MLIHLVVIFASSFFTTLIIGFVVSASKSDLLEENFRLKEEIELKIAESKCKDREIENLHKKYKMDRMV